jgi:two-component system, response regulator PdtaR
MSASRGALRIAVADDEPDMRLFFTELLPALGHQVVAVAATGRELVRQCREVHPDLVITDIKMPDLDGLIAAREVNRDGPVPVVLVTGHPEVDPLGQVGAEYVMAYLAKPVKPVDLQAAIALAVARFEQFQQLTKEAADLKQALEDRKVVERAKGAVVRRTGSPEDEAYRRMRNLASNANKKMAEVAADILRAEQVFRDLEAL